MPSDSPPKKDSPRLQVVEDGDQGAARALPNAIGPEKSILSSMMQEPTEYIGAAIEEHLSPGHFYIPAHGVLYEVLRELYENGQPIELVSLTQLLKDRGLLENLGGPGELTSIYTYSPTAAHFEHHLGIVKSKHILRSVISSCTESISKAYEDPEDVQSFLDAVEAKVFAIKEDSEVQGETKVGDLIEGVIEVLQ